jgi:hypothetical protein
MKENVCSCICVERASGASEAIVYAIVEAASALVGIVEARRARQAVTYVVVQANAGA